MVKNVSHPAPGCAARQGPAVACLARRTGVIATEPDVPVPDSRNRVRRRVAVASPAWLHSDSGGRCFPTARRATCTSWTGRGHLRAAGRCRDGGRGLDRARGWSTRTATSGSTRTVPSTTRRPSSRRSTDRDAGALLLRDCGSAADTVLDPRPRGPAAAGPGRSAHRPHQALHPQLRPRGRARRAPGVRRPGGAARRRLGQAGRRLDRPRLRRPRAVLPGRRVRRGHPASPTSTAPRSPPTASARRCCRA